MLLCLDKTHYSHYIFKDSKKFERVGAEITTGKVD